MYASILAAVTATLAVLSSATPEVEKRYTTHRGPATFFYQGGNAGSCGQVHKDSDYIVAISSKPPLTYNRHCGQQVTIKNVGGGQSNNGVGKTITATVADECRTESGGKCSVEHLDLSTGAFKALTGGHLDPPGEFTIEWHLN